MLYRTDKDGNLIQISGNSNLAYQGNSLPIGSIFTSALPQTSNKYHLLNGDCLEVNGTYSGFFNYLISLVSQGYSVTCTANDYAEDLYKVGSCGRFVLNNTSNEIVGSYTNEEEVVVEFIIPAYSFKLPSVSSVVQGVNSLEELGKAVEAGLPNITGSGIFGFEQTTASAIKGAVTQKPGDVAAVAKNLNTDYKRCNFSIDASLSNPIYGNSETVQPSSIKYPYYIVLISGSALDIKANAELTGDEEVLKSINIGGKNYLLGCGSSSDLLWENPDSSIEFSSQVITIKDYSSYDLVGIYFKDRLEGVYEGEDLKLVKLQQNGVYELLGSYAASVPLVRYLHLTTGNANEILIENCLVIGSPERLFNNCLIPTKIVGIKLNSSSQQFKPQVYSTEETPIGVWIDGKTIYRKILQTTMPTSNTSTWINLLDLGFTINQLIILNGTMHGKDGRQVKIPSYESTAYTYNLSLSPDNTAIEILGSGYDSFGGQPIEIILEYTKNN